MMHHREQQEHSPAFGRNQTLVPLAEIPETAEKSVTFALAAALQRRNIVFFCRVFWLLVDRKL
jgi:hypothetical protein